MQRTPEDIQDELLVLRCQEGEPAAFKALVAQWHSRLQGLAQRLTHDPDAARDLVQESWVAIVRGLGRLDDPARFRVWAYRIVTNKCADWVRRRTVRRDAVENLQRAANARNDGSETPASDEAEEIGRLRVALAQLPHDSRIILWLHYLDGLSVVDIATALDLPAGTVKSRLHGARERLKKILEGGHHERPGQENP
jgi:RNA polymerase sigma-70 factor (ECF subfamily)